MAVWSRANSVGLTTTGEWLRQAILLCRNAAPIEPTVENAYRETHLWVNVSASG